MSLVAKPKPPKQPMTPSATLLGGSAARVRIEEDIDCAARSDAKVLITGESGVGKEIVARLIHERSARRQQRFVALNCAGLPDSLLESELFGHERGSFTGADRNRPGTLELAHRGTLLLDEVGEMSVRLQAVLLRFLETGELQRLGARATSPRVDVRVLAATNRRLADRVKAGEFRADLYYRLNVILIVVPPIRERRDDIPAFLAHFMRTQGLALGLPVPELSDAVREALLAYHWPGNVRELKNLVERMIVRARDGRVTEADLPVELKSQAARATPAPTQAVPVARHELVGSLMSRMVDGNESFWEVVYGPLMARDLTRAQVRQLVGMGLERTRGSYRLLVELFNMSPNDYKRFLNVLRKLDCHVAFQQYRVAKTSRTPPGEAGSVALGD